uniref:Retrotransposon protein, putative, unclassified n=2 Tax=Oryza sativa subsp. japonica TaxID=39947 RepID=A0A5S6R8W3_ORYSJ|nr:Hypothetical protein [Oryza sativa Japonica Group]ABB47257.2 retrotransposon protein, putative, unclassified [Oryza sativa Japonica Group]
MAGLKVNYHKSEIFTLGLSDNDTNRVAMMFNCPVGQFPIKYLGLPIGPDKILNLGFDFLGQKLEKRLNSWGNNLSHAGRAVQINACLSSIPSYAMGFYQLPEGVHQKFDSIRGRYYWAGNKLKGKYHMWRKLFRSEEECKLDALVERIRQRVWANDGEIRQRVDQDADIAAEAGANARWTILSLAPSCRETWTGFSMDAFRELRRFTELAIPSAMMVWSGLDYSSMEWWSFELVVLLSGLLPNPKLETSALSICLNTGSLMFMVPFGLCTAIRKSNLKSCKFWITGCGSRFVLFFSNSGNHLFFSGTGEPKLR